MKRIPEFATSLRDAALDVGCARTVARHREATTRAGCQAGAASIWGGAGGATEEVGWGGGSHGHQSECDREEMHVGFHMSWSFGPGEPVWSTWSSSALYILVHGSIVNGPLPPFPPAAFPRTH